MYKVYENPPKDFEPQLNVAACYLEFKGKFLFLKRNPNSSQGVPGECLQEKLRATSLTCKLQ